MSFIEWHYIVIMGALTLEDFLKVEEHLESYLGHFSAVLADFLTKSGKPIENKIAKEKNS